MGEGKDSSSFSLGEKVAEGRGRMRGLVIHKILAKARNYKLALQGRLRCPPPPLLYV
jgi:hypothetical protein